MDMLTETAVVPEDANAQEPSEADKALVDQILQRIAEDKSHHKKAFDRMRRDMNIALDGRTEDWPEEYYTANIVGRHIKRKSDALYAKNPKAVARRRETLDFAVWDENPDSLMLAFQTVQAASAAQPTIDMATGMAVPPQLPPGFFEAQELLEDFQAGMARREDMKKLGKTLEVLFGYFMREQKPTDFKTGVRQLVRRACTTGVGYLEVGAVREVGPRPDVQGQLADAQARLDHLRWLMEEAADGEIDGDDAEAAELQRSIEALMNEPEIVLREGLVFDYPQSTKVIPDRLCRQLTGFVGARHITLEYLFSPDEVEEQFPGVDLENGYTPYDGKGRSTKAGSEGYVDLDREDEGASAENTKSDMVCVYKHYDKKTGLVYYVAEGYKDFLRTPAPPDVFVEDFWPVYVLTFNAVEHEDELFPPSDVGLLRSMQQDYNRSRQGNREHREAARPRWASARGSIDDDDAAALSKAKPFSVTPIDLPPGEKITDKLAPIPVPGVDPNLYETGTIFTDTQIVVGSQEANFGGVAKATATESAIAANSTASMDGAGVDDLDAFLTAVIRASGQVLLREMSTEQVRRIAGPGAFWPENMSLADIADEVFLEIEAGSSGKPNQATEVRNWQQLLPFLIQMPGINPMWLAKETIRRLDDRLDLTEAIAAGMPSIVMQNAQSQPSPADPANDPAAQGAEGASNGPAGPAEQPPGSGPAFGSNQVQ